MAKADKELVFSSDLDKILDKQKSEILLDVKHVESSLLDDQE